MKKNLFIFIIWCFTLQICVYAQNVKYIFTKDTNAEYNNQLFPIAQNSIINWDGSIYKSSISYDPYEDTFNTSIYYEINDSRVRLPIKDMEIVNSDKLFENEFIQLIPVYYLKILKDQNPKSLFDYEPQWNNFTDEKYYDFGGNFLSAFRTETIILSNLVCLFNKKNPYIFEEVHKKDNSYIIKMTRPNRYDYTYNAPLPNIIQKKSNINTITLIFEFDGDYVDIWIDTKENYLGQYFFAPLTTQNEIHYLIADKYSENEFNISNVYWPRHADGRSDYDNEIKPPLIASIKTNSYSVGNQISSTPAVAIKTMYAKTNLKLYSDATETSSVISEMKIGTNVDVREIGKEETINGITANWVKVEILSGAKDTSGATIPSGTIGWCFEGYLRDIPSGARH